MYIYISSPTSSTLVVSIYIYNYIHARITIDSVSLNSFTLVIYIYIYYTFFQEITAAPRFPQLSYAVGCRAPRAWAAAWARRRRRPCPPATPCRRSTGRHWQRWPRGSRRLKDTVAMGKHQGWISPEIPKKGDF